MTAAAHRAANNDPPTTSSSEMGRLRPGASAGLSLPAMRRQRRSCRSWTGVFAVGLVFCAFVTPTTAVSSSSTTTAAAAAAAAVAASASTSNGPPLRLGPLSPGIGPEVEERGGTDDDEGGEEEAAARRADARQRRRAEGGAAKDRPPSGPPPPATAGQSVEVIAGPRDGGGDGNGDGGAARRDGEGGKKKPPPPSSHPRAKDGPAPPPTNKAARVGTTPGGAAGGGGERTPKAPEKANTDNAAANPETSEEEDPVDGDDADDVDAQKEAEDDAGTEQGTTDDKNVEEQQISNQPAAVPSTQPPGNPAATPSPDDKQPPRPRLDCESATTCELCMDEADAALDADVNKTCIWKWAKKGKDAGECNETQKSEHTSTEAEFCSKGGTGGGQNEPASGGNAGGDKEPSSGGNGSGEKQPPSGPSAGGTGGTIQSPSAAPTVKADFDYDADEGAGIGTGFVLVLLLLGVGGGAYYARSKMQFSLPPGVQGALGGPGTGFGGGARSTKYEQIALEEDEEWGWGDDDDNEDDDIELAPSNAIDPRVHSRRQSSGEVPVLSSKTTATTHGGFVSPSRVKHTRTPSYAATPPRNTSAAMKIPAAPSSAPRLESSITSNGTSRGGIAQAPISAAPALGIAATFHSDLPSSIGGVPTQITSLGKKKPTPTQPKKAPPPSEEDDIFASMGLAAKPNFTHGHQPTRQVTAASPSRWTQTAISGSTSADAAAARKAGAARPPPTSMPSSANSRPTPLVASAPVPSTIASNTFDDILGGDDNVDWGDDADLDDLLDD